jgi:predicted secreted protein
MNKLRRVFLKTIVLASGFALTKPSYATDIIDTDKIDIKLPKTAEKNASIPITISTSLADIDTLTFW